MHEEEVEAVAKAIAADEWPDLGWDYIVRDSDPERFRSHARAALRAMEPYRHKERARAAQNTLSNG